jgi:hypothetical protein
MLQQGSKRRGGAVCQLMLRCRSECWVWYLYVWQTSEEDMNGTAAVLRIGEAGHIALIVVVIEPFKLDRRHDLLN